MYGMVHCSLRDMATERLGGDAWEKICASAKLDPVGVAMTHEVYSDDISFRLFAVAAEKLGLSTGDFMEALGQSWISYARTGKYKSMFQACGSDIQTFIGNLDHLHGAVSSAMAGSKTGSFEVLSSGPGCMVIRYIGARLGLDRFLTGLMKGLLASFNLLGSVNVMTSEGNTTELLLKYEPDLSR